jgi:hypothetical protein
MAADAVEPEPVVAGFDDDGSWSNNNNNVGFNPISNDFTVFGRVTMGGG